MSSTGKMKPLPKFILLFAIIGGIAFGAMKFTSSDKFAEMTAGSEVEQSETEVTKKVRTPVAKTSSNGTRVYTIGVGTWGGYVGGQWYNAGFKASAESRFYTEFGIKVKFVLNDNYEELKQSFRDGEVDIIWTTVDISPVNMQELSDIGAKLFFVADWSRGGDVLVGTGNIKSINDLRGKRIACTLGNPSHTLLLKSLAAAGMTQDDVIIIPVDSPPEAVELFVNQEVDAACVWSPDDQTCLADIPESRIVTSTSDAKFIIADGFYAKDTLIESDEENLTNLVRGWLTGNAEMNQSSAKQAEGAKILAKGLGQPISFCKTAINNARLTTYGDNVNFFNIEGTYKGITGKHIYTSMTKMYKSVGLVTKAPRWNSIVDTSIIMNINDLTGPKHAKEPRSTFKKMTVATAKKKVTFSKKDVTINFASGTAVLSAEAKRVLNTQVVQMLKEFPDKSLRVEGNTDSVGSFVLNQKLSKTRATAVVNYLCRTQGFNCDRFIIIGNGPTNPVADNSTTLGKARNRRTDFVMLQ